jgi:HEAT repeat protein
MIFRWLWRRRVVGLFGEIATPRAIDEIIANSTELDCLKLLLPGRIRSLMWKPAMTERQALLEVRRMALEILAKAKKPQS